MQSTQQQQNRSPSPPQTWAYVGMMDGQALHVLLIENDAEYARLLQDVLGAAFGAPFHLEHTGLLAADLESVRPVEGSVDVILLDLSLAETWGPGMLTQISAQAPNLPIILLSGFEDEELAVEAVREGAQDYLVKGQMDAHLLARAIRYAIERKRVEAELRQNEERFRTVADFTYDWECWIGGDGCYIYVSPACERITGYQAQEFIQDPNLLIAITHPDDRASIAHHLEAEIDDGQVHHLDFRILTQRGEERWIEHMCQPVYSADGRWLGRRSSNRDSTERKQAAQLLQRQLTELTVLHTIATAAAEATDEDSLIRQAVEAIGELLYPNDLQVWLLDEAAGELRLHPSCRAGDDAHLAPIPLGQTPAGQVAADGQPRRISSLPPADASTRAMVCVPLKAGAEILGVISAESTQRDGFSETDERLLSTCAGQLATTIEKVRLMATLEQRVSDRTRELSSLYDITAVTSESLDRQRVLEQALERTLNVMKSQRGDIHLLDETEGTLRLAAQMGAPPSSPSSPSTDVEKSTSLSSVLAAWIVDHDEPLVAPEIAADPRIPSPQLNPPGSTSSPSQHPQNSYIGVPVRAWGKTLGVMGLFGKAKRQFNPEEIALLSSIADRVGVAVENSRLRRQAEQAAVLRERERLSRELHDSVTQTLYSVTLFAEAGRDLAHSADQPQKLETCLTELQDTALRALQEMRLLVHELRPSVLEQEGLIGALQQRLDTVEGRSGIETRLLVDGVIDLPIPVEQELYRIAQEGLNNILRHAAATSVIVRLRAAESRIELELVDDGRGFDPDTANTYGGMGLTSMKERAERLGGKLRVTSAPGQGTRVSVSIEAKHPPDD